MSSTVLVLIIVLVLTAWLGSLVVQLEREITRARRRGYAAEEKERRIQLMIDNMLSEERTLTQQLNEQNRANAEAKKVIESLRTELAERQRGGRQRLLVMNPRRQPGDREWIATLINPTLKSVDPTQPLAEEWAEGRNYLVFARSENEARERTSRRFANRPGVSIKSVVAAPDDIFNAPPIPLASS